jgi:hypothetical protein
MQPEVLESLTDRVTALESQLSQFREEVRVEFSTTRSELGAGMRRLNDETRAQMRVLHEDVVARIALLGEHRGRIGGRKRVTRTQTGSRNSKKRR